jgi:hypothetical protein
MSAGRPYARFLSGHRGALTVHPVAEIVAGNLSSCIRTELVSITDGSGYADCRPRADIESKLDGLSQRYICSREEEITTEIIDRSRRGGAVAARIN